MQSNAGTPRSRSRSKRSTANLSNLRLAPLSTKYAEPVHDETLSARSPYSETHDVEFARQHPSYLHERSAPSTPGILSRSSTRNKQLDGGWSRRSSLYDNSDSDMNYTYNAGSCPVYGNERAEVGSGNIPKAKSEAALMQKQHRLAGRGVRVSRTYGDGSTSRTGANTPRTESFAGDTTWLTRTGAATSAILQESKGQSWLATRESSTSLAGLEPVEDDEDEQYEEMAAMSASTARFQYTGGHMSPVSTRTSRWGSRYGSRANSTRTSRLASPTGLRTPRRGEVAGYFDDHPMALPAEEPSVLMDRDLTEQYEDQMEVERLTMTQSFGLGGLVDRVMNFKLFRGDEQGDTTDDEAGREAEAETNEEATQRMAAEAERKRREKEKLVTQPPPAPLGGGKDGNGEAGGWQDAAWLLSVASKAFLQ